MTVHRPTTSGELADIIRSAGATGRKLAIRGGGSKDGIGAPARAAESVDMRSFVGIDYDPAELVLTVGAGTPLADIEALVRGEGQMLAFDPFDHGPVFSMTEGQATIGGVVAAGVAGSRRLTAGAVRDHLLGFAAVSGRGEAFVGGARVVKNVTGYDLPKVLTGSWGRLAALTEVTLKVLPAPRESMTRVVRGLRLEQAYLVMVKILGSQAAVSAAAHIPAHISQDRAITAFRIEGFGPSVVARTLLIERLLADTAPVETASTNEAAAIWQMLRTLDPLGDGLPLWRVSIPAKACAMVIAALRPQGARWMMDWGGALIWLGFAGDPELVRSAARAAGGHAMLVRGNESLRIATPAFHPCAPAVANIEARVRRAFDPMGVFETGRFGEYPHAD